MGDRPAIYVDRERWPISIARVEGQPTDEEFVAYLDELKRNHDTGELYVSIVATSPSAPMTRARHAKMQARWIAEHEDAIRRLCLGVVFVLPSPVMRGVLRAILKMQSLPTPYAVFRHEAEAIAWARQKLDERGVA